MQEQPAAGVHPRHICLELDPETQAILAAGWGPRSRSTSASARTLALVERLRRRLRSKGMRASYNLQMVGDCGGVGGSSGGGGEWVVGLDGVGDHPCKEGLWCCAERVEVSHRAGH